MIVLTFRKLLFIILFLVSFWLAEITYATGTDTTINTSTATITIASQNTYSPDSLPTLNISSKSNLWQKIIDLLGGAKNNPQISIYGPDDQILLSQSIDPGSSTLTLEQDMLKPGNYQIYLNQEPLTSFAWGVLVLNLNKDSYQLNEQVYFQVSSLDDRGHTLCHSNLELKINDTPLPLIQSQTCGVNNVTDEPDYFAHFQVQALGTHQVKLTNLDNGHTLTDSFTVHTPPPPIVVERRGATRINPFRSDYSHTISVTANQNYQGIITETLPSSFLALTPISWEVSIPQGDTQVFSYSYRAPTVSPAVFTLGPLQLNGYQESRAWSLASDAVDTNSPTSDSGGWSNPSNAYSDGSGYANITSGNPSASHTYGDYNFSLGTNVIDQVRVRYDSYSIGGSSQNQVRSGSDITGDEANSAAFTTSPLFSKVNDSNDSTFIVGVSNGGGHATFNFNAFSIPLDSSITDVAVTFRARNNTGTAGANGAGVIKVNGVYYRPSGRTVPTNVQPIGEYTDTWSTNPNTSSAWTVADINGSGSNPLQAFGVGGSDFNPDVNFYEVSATVNYTTAHNEQISVDVSWDGGSTWSTKQTTTLTGSETTYWYDVTSATDWTPAKLNNTNLKVRVESTTVGDPGDVRLDWIPVEVTSTPTLTLSGTVYTNETGTNIGAGKTVNLRLNGGGTYSTVTNGSGVWQISELLLDPGDIISLYLDNETEEATTIVVSDGTAKSDLHLYVNRVAVRHDTLSALTPDHLYLGDDGDDDVKYNISAASDGNLTIDPGFEFHIWSGSNFELSGGTLITQGSDNVHLDDGATLTLDTDDNQIAGDLVIDDSSLANIDANLTISGGNIAVSGSGDLSSTGGTLTIGGTGTIGGGSTGSSLQLTNLTINSGTITLGSDSDNVIEITQDVTVSAGATLAMNNKTLDINGGNLTTISTGAITCSSCTSGGVLLSGDGTTNGVGGGSGSLTLYTLTLDGASHTTSIGSPTLTLLSDLVIGSGRTLVSASGGTINVGGNWTNAGGFTHNSGVVNFAGSDSTTQAISGSTTFFDFTSSTLLNSVGRTLQFAGNSTTTVTGTWTITGYSSKVLTLQSSDTNNWTINPTAASVDYASISRSSNTGGEFCATHSTGDGNNLGWDITPSSTCNLQPDIPTLLSPPDTAVEIARTPTLQTIASDPDADYLRYKLELCEDSGMSIGCQTFDQTSSQTGWSGQNTQSNTAYTSGSTASYTLQSNLPYLATYYWRSYAIDPAGKNIWSDTQASPFSFTTMSEVIVPVTIFGNTRFYGGVRLY